MNRLRAMRTLLLALIVGLVIVPLAAPSAVADEDAEVTPASRFMSCTRGGGQGSVLLLFDTSGSLKRTDPDNARVTASKLFVSRLAEILGESPESNVQVALAGFDHSFSKTLDWTDLDAEHLDPINADLDAYAERRNGPETDYWKAVDGARQELAQRQQAEGDHCSMVVWFSDGGFAISKRANADVMQKWGGLKPYAPDNKLATRQDAARAMQDGQEDMCRPGGVADQLRSMDVITLGIGLAVDSEPKTFDLMQGFSAAETIPCGDITKPKPGTFTMATDIDDLIWAFAEASSEGSDVQETGLCKEGEEPCAEGTRTFVLDGSIGRVQAITQLPVDGGRVLLQTRDGALTPMPKDGDNAKVPGATLRWKWLSDRTLTLMLEREGQSEEWIGPWGLVFVASTDTDELAKSSLQLFGDVQPVWTNRKDVTIRTDAKPVDLQLGLVNSKGETIDPATLSDESQFDVSLTGSDGETRQLVKDKPVTTITEPIALDPGSMPAGGAQLWITLNVTTQSWTGQGKTVEGTKLEPIRVMTPLSVAPPEDFPTIPAKVSFGETEQADPVTVTVPLEGEGCVWLGEKTQFTGYPKGLDSAKLSSPAADEGSCSSSGLELTLDPSGTGHGALVGKAEVWLKSPSAKAGTPVQLEFDLQMQRPASQPVLWGTLIGVTLLGIAIPVGILYLSKYLTSKIPGNAVLAQQFTGPVDDSRAFTDNGLDVDLSRMSIAQLAGGRRKVDVAGVQLRAKTGLALTEPGYVVVEQPGKAAGGRTSLASAGDKAKLPLAVQGNWTVALHPERPTSGDVTVTVFTGPGAPGITELTDDIRGRIRDAVAKLREGLPPDAQPPTSDPWGGGPSAGGQPDPWSNPPTQSTTRWNPQGGPSPSSGPQTGWQSPPPSGQPGGQSQWQQPPNSNWGNQPPSGGAGW